MMDIEKEDWDELVRILKETESGVSVLNGGDCAKEIEQFRQSLQSFHTTAAMFGLADLEKAGIELQNFLSSQIAPASNVDNISAFGFAVSSLVDQMGTQAGSINVDEILELLGPPPAGENLTALSADDLPPEAQAEEAGSPDESSPQSDAEEGEDGLGLNRLNDLVKTWGGELSLTTDGSSNGQFSLTFSGPVETLHKIEKLLCTADPDGTLAFAPAPDAKLDKIVAKGKEFMEAFSGGDLEQAQQILLSLTDQQYQTGLYKEIGSLARGLHDSIRSFLNTLDPSLKDMVEDKIPDTGNRLEHMMELTEKAAITTLDHVEAIQERLEKEQEHIAQLKETIKSLNAIGDPAGKKLADSGEILRNLEGVISQHREDLDAILTAQDYQDLSGQIILKISKMLKDMELKLVNLIRTFGVKETGKPKESSSDELYGPAHQAREESVHSQDEVDSLLAEFGF